MMAEKPEKQKAYYGLPDDVVFCKRCVITNQYPTSRNEYLHTKDSKVETMIFDDEGVCLACRGEDMKYQEINWEEREKELLELLAQYRKDDGSYDILVPGSGGKDSAYASHLLKYKYNMHPLTVTWAPHLYTDIGWENFQNWIHVGGLDNFLFTPNGKVHRKLTRLAFENLCHPFQPFIIGQKAFSPKIAKLHNIQLVFYGEMPIQYGESIPATERKFRLKGGENDGYVMDWKAGKKSVYDLYIAGVNIGDLLESGFTKNDLEPYLPLETEEIVNAGIEFHYLGYYIKWVPQEAYYYAVKNTGFKANPVRTAGTYSKYNSLDDRIDRFFYYTMLIKFGLDRVHWDASQEIRNKHITREEGIALVKRFIGEPPTRYFKEVLEYMDISEKEFWEICDKHRSPHLWKKVNGEWKLLHELA